MRTDIRDLSDEELEQELERRKEKSEKTSALPVPKPLANIDWARVISIAQEGVQNLARDRPYLDDDFDTWVFEAVMEAVYGKNIWKWWNSR